MKKKNYNKPSTSTAEQRRNKIYAIILACAMVFWTIASLLGTFAFARTLTGSAETATVREVERKKALADDGLHLSSYEVDLHLTGATCFYSSGAYGLDSYGVFENAPKLIFYYNTNTVALDTGSDTVYFSTTGVSTTTASFTYTDFETSVEQGGVSIYPSLTGESVDFSCLYIGNSELSNFSNHWVSSVDVSLFYYSASVLRYEYLLYWSSPTLEDAGTTSFYIIMEDVRPSQDSPYYYTIYPYLSWDGSISYPNEQRLDIGSFDTIWFSLYPDLINIVNNNEQFGYNSGYNDGYETGSENGYNDGLSDGYNRGRQEGYAEGFQQGVQDAGDYTFFTLISAVIDAPIQAFTGLFNFDLLGINLADFFFSLLTVAAIIAVIRLFL